MGDPHAARWQVLIGNPALRWIVTVPFGVSIATYVYVLVVQRDRGASTVNHVLDLTMSAAMILMAWRIGVSFPTVGPMIFFLLAGVWFVRVGGRERAALGESLTVWEIVGSAAVVSALALVAKAGRAPCNRLRCWQQSGCALTEQGLT